MKDKSIPTYKSVKLAGKFVMVDGKLTKQYNSEAHLQHFINTYAKAGDDFSEELTCKRPKRSDALNNYYHLYLSLIALSSGHTMKELKEWAVGKFLTKGIKEVFGDKTRITDSSADLNMDEFGEFLNELEETTEIPLPDPKPFKMGLLLTEEGKLKREQKEKYSKMKPKGLVPVWHQNK
jgi:hypothetical protein